jgi:acyl dehydratase
LKDFPIEATQIFLFARAIGDQNPVYSDSNSPQAMQVGGIVAPPTFVMSEAQFDAQIALKTQTGSNPSSTESEAPGESFGNAGLLHAEQSFEYHQAVRPGMVLHSTQRDGATWEKSSRRGGTLRFRETVIEYRNLDGDLLITSRRVSVVTDRPVNPEE